MELGITRYSLLIVVVDQQRDDAARIGSGKCGKVLVDLDVEIR